LRSKREYRRCHERKSKMTQSIPLFCIRQSVPPFARQMKASQVLWWDRDIGTSEKIRSINKNGNRPTFPV
jgi:hypothetical protein